MTENIRGRWRVDNPVASLVKREVEEWPALEAESSASRIFVSTFFAIISAAFPRGARINGTWPM